jgi:hypothetical protein
LGLGVRVFLLVTFFIASGGMAICDVFAVPDLFGRFG